jgi:hypothetical protein
MGKRDDVLSAIGQIHAAGIDPAKWPDALGAITSLVGGNGASLEVLSRPALRHVEMHSFALPAVGPYLEYYAAFCPRLSKASDVPGTLSMDGQYIDEAGMDANPFYMELLAPYDMRYYIGACLASSTCDVAITGVQRSPRQGHPNWSRSSIPCR